MPEPADTQITENPAANPSGRVWAAELLGIEKRFGSVHANRDVTLRFAPGSIHGLVGENGAGKSTLMSILYGFYQADAGEIRVGGSAVSIRTPQDALNHGIGMVHQHFMLVNNFSVIENLLLGAEDGALLRPAFERARESVRQLERSFGLEVPLDRQIADLPVGLQQRVEILKALYRGAKLLILDEPTAVLSPPEVQQLFAVLRRLRDEGRTILLITHKLKEIMAVTDRVSVLRHGAVVAEFDTAATNEQEIADSMVGRRAVLTVNKGVPLTGPLLLQARNLTVRDAQGVARLKSASLSIRGGEIVGIAGVAGNGQSELLQALAGMVTPNEGQITIRDQIFDRAHPLDPRQARRLGMAHVPEDRLRLGIVKQFPARENAILGYHDDASLTRGPLLLWRQVLARTAGLMERFDVRPRQPALRSALFSGGNQQKLVMAREMDREPDVLLVGQPTRGVDIGAIAFIHEQIIAMRNRGKAILLVSAELDEIMALADRILVMCDGEIVGELAAAEASEGRIGRMMAGLTAEAA